MSSDIWFDTFIVTECNEVFSGTQLFEHGIKLVSVLETVSISIIRDWYDEWHNSTLSRRPVYFSRDMRFSLSQSWNLATNTPQQSRAISHHPRLSRLSNMDCDEWVLDTTHCSLLVCSWTVTRHWEAAGCINIINVSKMHYHVFRVTFQYLSTAHFYVVLLL
jgi:hypothetical protein